MTLWLLAVSIAIPAAYLGLYTTASKYQRTLPSWALRMSRPIYTLGVAGAVTAVGLGVFFAAFCLVDPFSESLSADFLPTLQDYMNRMSTGAIKTYASDYHYLFDISKPWVVYFVAASYCGVVAASSLAALASNGTGGHGVVWRVGWDISWTLGEPLRILYLMVFRRLKRIVIFVACWLAFWAVCTGAVHWAMLE